ncbi:MAG: hypothetical protein ACQR33_05975 [Candidatus Saccharibacteria bacterium]
MIAITPQNLPERLTIRMILQEALSRNWQAFTYALNGSHAVLIRPDGKELSIYSSCPPATPYVGARISDDKYLTHLVLEDAGLPLLATYRCQTEAEATLAVQKIIDSGKGYVIKPLDASHGNGITVGMQTLEQLPVALAYANRFSPTTIIQAYQAQPIDLRVLCIDYKVAAVLERIPARVTGDGTHTIAELITLENKQRGTQYTSDLSTIPLDRAEAFFGGAINDVLASGEVIQVLGTANMGTGGEGHDVTDDVPAWLVTMAEQAAHALGLPVCGVDFLVTASPRPTATVAELQPSITEVNKCPSLFIHEQPMHGAGHPVTAMYVDYLAKI